MATLNDRVGDVVGLRRVVGSKIDGRSVLAKYSLHLGVARRLGEPEEQVRLQGPGGKPCRRRQLPVAGCVMERIGQQRVDGSVYDPVGIIG